MSSLDLWQELRGTESGLRRVMHPDGQRDEAFGHDLAWRHTFLLYSAEHGNLDNKLRQINGIEAARIVGRVRAAAAAAAS